MPKCPCGVLYAVLGFCPKDLSSRKRTKFLAAMFANIINDSHHDAQFIYQDSKLLVSVASLVRNKKFSQTLKKNCTLTNQEKVTKLKGS